MYISPRCNGNKPRITFKRVDFPAPLDQNCKKVTPINSDINVFNTCLLSNNNQYFLIQNRLIHLFTSLNTIQLYMFL